MSGMNESTGWGGRVDRHDGDAGLRWHQVVTDFDSEFNQGAVFLGLCSDEGVRRNQGRVGASAGPLTLRRMLSNLPVHSPMFLQDAGDVVCLGGELESAQARYAQIGSQVLASNRRLIGLGGGHEIGFASYLALAQSGIVKPNERVGILNLDSHFDIRREPQATSGTPFLQALDDASRRLFQLEYRVMGISRAANTRALFETAKEHGVQWKSDSEMSLLHVADRVAELRQWLPSLDHIYLTVCLDVLPAAVAPGVSSPAARGVSLEVIEMVIEMLMKTGKVRVADVAELSPAYDIDHRTARTAARLVWLMTQP